MGEASGDEGGSLEVVMSLSLKRCPFLGKLNLGFMLGAAQEDWDLLDALPALGVLWWKTVLLPRALRERREGEGEMPSLRLWLWLPGGLAVMMCDTKLVASLQSTELEGEAVDSPRLFSVRQAPLLSSEVSPRSSWVMVELDRPDTEPDLSLAVDALVGVE